MPKRHASKPSRHRCDTSWLQGAKGKSTKIVAPLLGGLPGGLHYRILFMDRDMEEILASQTAMLARLGKPHPNGEVSKAYQQQIRHARKLIHRKGIPAMSIGFSDLIAGNDRLLTRLLEFTKRYQQSLNYKNLVDPKLYRARKSDSWPKLKQ